MAGTQLMGESSLTGLASKSELSLALWLQSHKHLLNLETLLQEVQKNLLKAFHPKQDFLKTQDSQHSGSACTSPWTCSDFPTPALNPTWSPIP